MRLTKAEFPSQPRPRTPQPICTDQSCPVMCAGRRFKYLWRDGGLYPEATAVSGNGGESDAVCL